MALALPPERKLAGTRAVRWGCGKVLFMGFGRRSSVSVATELHVSHGERDAIRHSVKRSDGVAGHRHLIMHGAIRLGMSAVGQRWNKLLWDRGDKLA